MRPTRRTRARRSVITPAQREVIALASLGLSDTEIAIERGCSPATVHRHIGDLLRVLDCGTRIEAMQIAAGVELAPLIRGASGNPGTDSAQVQAGPGVGRPDTSRVADEARPDRRMP